MLDLRIKCCYLTAPRVENGTEEKTTAHFMLSVSDGFSSKASDAETVASHRFTTTMEEVYRHLPGGLHLQGEETLRRKWQMESHAKGTCMSHA